MNSPVENFKSEVVSNIEKLGEDNTLKKISMDFVYQSALNKYSYNFSALGRPIIQYPQDMVAIQELVWKVKPDLIIETGIAHGGSLIQSASMLALIDYCEAAESKNSFDPLRSKRRVLGIDVDIRKHNREAIAQHPLAHLIDMIEGSSTDEETINQVQGYAKEHHTIMVFLDSNHTHDHVLAELEAYAPLTSRESYCVVFDTCIEDMPEDLHKEKPWGRGDNPKTAVRAYLDKLEKNKDIAFEIDMSIDNKLSISVAPQGYLKRL